MDVRRNHFSTTQSASGFACLVQTFETGAVNAIFTENSAAGVDSGSFDAYFHGYAANESILQINIANNADLSGAVSALELHSDGFAQLHATVSNTTMAFTQTGVYADFYGSSQGDVRVLNSTFDSPAHQGIHAHTYLNRESAAMNVPLTNSTLSGSSADAGALRVTNESSAPNTFAMTQCSLNSLNLARTSGGSFTVSGATSLTNLAQNNNISVSYSAFGNIQYSP